MPATKADGTNSVALLQQLVIAYEEQLDGYRRWLTLAEQARARVDDEELDEFLRLHGEKEGVAQQLQEREEQLRAQRETLRTHLRLEQFSLTELQRAQSDVEDPDAFAAVLEQFRDLLERLGAVMRSLEPVERDTETRLRQRLSGLRGELKDVHSTKRATRAYHQPNPDEIEARFIDHKG